MDSLDALFKHYLWMGVIFSFFVIGGSIYFNIQPLGLTLILGAVMLLISMENSDMIHAVKTYKIEDKPYRPFIVHFASQKHVAQFIFYYHVFVYLYIFGFSALILFSGIDIEAASNILNISLLVPFFIAVITIFIRMILVGAKIKEERG